MKDLIGKEIGVLDDDGKEIKKIIVKSVKKIGEQWIVSDNEGNIYSDDELNFSYSLTPKGCLYAAFYENGFTMSSEEIDDIWDSFYKYMKNAEYVEDSGDDNSE